MVFLGQEEPICISETLPVLFRFDIYYTLSFRLEIFFVELPVSLYQISTLTCCHVSFVLQSTPCTSKDTRLCSCVSQNLSANSWLCYSLCTALPRTQTCRR